MSVTISKELKDLTGVGMEFYIRKDGFVIEFLNGKFAQNIKPKGDTEDTIV